MGWLGTAEGVERWNIAFGNLKIEYNSFLRVLLIITGKVKLNLTGSPYHDHKYKEIRNIRPVVLAPRPPSPL